MRTFWYLRWSSDVNVSSNHFFWHSEEVLLELVTHQLRAGIRNDSIFYHENIFIDIFIRYFNVEKLLIHIRKKVDEGKAQLVSLFQIK